MTHLTHRLLISALSILFANTFLSAEILPPDPCEVLIGVETYSDCDGELGAFVSRTIEGSIAAAYGIMPGDIIVGIDQCVVDSPDELIAAKNKYQPGTAFVLHYIRAGRLYAANMRFPSCDHLQKETAKAPSAPIALSIVPNPTQGPFQLQITGASMPAQITISNMSGTIVWYKKLDRFDGIHNELIALDAVPGVFTVQVTQGAQHSVQKMVLMPN